MSPYAREVSLFDGESMSDAATLLLADIISSGKTGRLRDILADYNGKAVDAAQGQTDMFSGMEDGQTDGDTMPEVPTKESLLTEIIKFFDNATTTEQRERIQSAIAARKARAGAEQPAAGDQAGEQIADAVRGGEAGRGSGAAATGDSAAAGSQAISGSSAEGVREIQRPLTESEADEALSRMEANAVPTPHLELNPQTWVEQFGEDGKVTTPIGTVKMGANQIAKLFEKGRSEQFGMIRPTLETPLVIIEVPSEAADGNTERATSLLFVKTFLGKNGEKVYYFKSVTVKKDGMEVSVSSHYDRPKRIKEALKKGSCYTDLTVAHRPNNALPMFL